MSVKELLYLDPPKEQTNKRRILFGVLLIVWVGLSLLVKFTYRPYIYSNHLNDFHIADTLGNIFAVPAFILFYYALSKTVRYTTLCVVLIAWISWTFFELVLTETFDWYDIIANTIMCLLSYPIMVLIEKRLK